MHPWNKNQCSLWGLVCISSEGCKELVSSGHCFETHKHRTVHFLEHQSEVGWWEFHLLGSLFAGRIWAKLTVPRWNTSLSAASSGSTALKIYIVPMDFKIFILDSRYITKPSFSAVRLIACMIGTKSSYTPSTALLVDSQRVLKAFRTFFATIMISKKLILEAKNTNNLPPVSNYELDLTNIRNPLSRNTPTLACGKSIH